MPTRSLFVLLVSSALVAQTVSPLHYTAAEGASNNVYPFGNTAVPFRYSQIHDDVPLMVISGMSFRHNAATAIYPAHSITMDAWISTAVTPSGSMSATFDNNHGVDKVQVVTNRTYNHPASNPFDLPGQFVLDYPFDFPFVFLGGGASLCWEVHVTAKTQTGSIIYDFSSSTATSAANPSIVIHRAGLGCIATGRTSPMAATAAQTSNWPALTSTMTINGSQLEANGITFFTIGFDQTIWNNTPLPAVIPTSTGAPSGTCTVYADILAASLVFASATGTATLPNTFTPDPSYHGVTLYSQIWGLDLAANPFGVTTSNVAMHQIIAPFASPLPLTRAWLSASLGPVGTASVGNGLITRFY